MSRLNLAVGECTAQGTRPYNEDGHVVFKNFNEKISDPALHDVERSLFAVYDGHGGDGCMKFLREHLHVNIAEALVETKGDATTALTLAFEKTEASWIDRVRCLWLEGEKIEKSGSTATVCLVEGDEVFCAFVGDSPAWMVKRDESTVELSRDHKANDKIEAARVRANGGEVRRSKKAKNGIFRLYPGGIAVARSFGDVKAKLPEFGGIPGTLIATPEIKRFVVSPEDCQFLVICSDGITDNLAKKEDLYRPMLEGFGSGLEVARKSQKLSKGLDLDTCVQYVAKSAVNNTLRRDGGYQDNATALIVMIGDTLVREQEQLNMSMRQFALADTLVDVM